MTSQGAARRFDWRHMEEIYHAAGLLAYSLLQGMKGARLRENQFADVGLLFGYAQETVPQMAKNIDGIQRPFNFYARYQQQFRHWQIYNGRTEAD